MNNEILVKVENLSKIYNTESEQLEILKNLSLYVEKGTKVVITGKSGSGKSTLLNVLGGMDKATSGRVFFNSSDISKYNDKQLTFFRR